MSLPSKSFEPHRSNKLSGISATEAISSRSPRVPPPSLFLQRADTCRNLKLESQPEPTFFDDAAMETIPEEVRKFVRLHYPPNSLTQLVSLHPRLGQTDFPNKVLDLASSLTLRVQEQQQERSFCVLHARKYIKPLSFMISLISISRLEESHARTRCPPTRLIFVSSHRPVLSLATVSWGQAKSR